MKTRRPAWQRVLSSAWIAACFRRRTERGGVACEIERAGSNSSGNGASRLRVHHICDWLVPTTDLLTDRGMLGPGVIDLPLLHPWMERSGYRGMYEVVIFSANKRWKRDPNEVLATRRARHRERS